MAADSSILPVALRDLRFRYGRNPVLRGVDLQIEAGEVVALLGPNGAGKTTLFRILTGTEQPDRGTRSFGGQLVDDVSAELRARLAHLAHHPQVYPLLTARENVELFCRLAQREGADVVGRLEQLGLGSVIDARVGTFSRGMAQRVALARALAQAPDLYVLDEPFTALDPAGRRELVELLRAERGRGAAVLVASHDLDAVAAVADRACVLRDGRIHTRADAAQGREAFRRQLSLALGELEPQPMAGPGPAPASTEARA